MKENLFRQKSLDKIKSPETLNDYIKVSNPGVWLLLVSIIILLAGACIWGLYGHINSTLEVVVNVASGSAVCYLDENDASKAEDGMTVKFADIEGTIIGSGKMTEYGHAWQVDTDTYPADGMYVGELVINSIQPASLIFK